MASSSARGSTLDSPELHSRWSDQSLRQPGGVDKDKWQRSLTSSRNNLNIRSVSVQRKAATSEISQTLLGPVFDVSQQNNHTRNPEEELDGFVEVTQADAPIARPRPLAPDKASRILGIRHRQSMEPIASTRQSIVSTHSAREAPPTPTFAPTLPLTSLYVVSGLPKSPHTWTLADPDSVLGLHHSDGAVNRWWRPEVLGSTVSPGAGGGKKKKRGEITKGAGALSKTEVGKMLSKALKLSFTREVEVVASTLQPASTIHTFTFTLPAPATPLAPTPSGDLLRSSVMTGSDCRASGASFAYPYSEDPFARPSSAYLGPPTFNRSASTSAVNLSSNTHMSSSGPVTYHGVCLTVFSHADVERSNAIRRTLEAGRSRKESSQSAVAARLRSMRNEINGSTSSVGPDPTTQARRSAKKGTRGPWTDVETDGDGETEAEGGAMSESDFEVASTHGGPGESTLFLPGDTVFWLPYALTLVSRHPIYDLMRDYLTLSWARFSKDVQSHTLQISKILAHPAPRAGDLIKLDASAKNDGGEASLEVIARFPGGLDFGRGLVDVNFTMWPLFKCLNIDNILTICEIALAPTGRILFFSRHPAMLGIAVATIKYLVELRGWNGIALAAVHSRDAKIYIDDPGPWIMGLATEARYSIRPAPEICVCDLDINYINCPSPPVGAISVKQQREKYRQRLLAAFDTHYHPDHGVPSEFKEAFPAGRFRPVCKIQAKRGASSSAVADTIKAPEWWSSTKIIQAFDLVLQDKFKKPSFLKRVTSFGAPKRAPQLTAAEMTIQVSIRKRATAFVDARDDLETKIGRLSRRLNFLMTESDLWRDKFVTFETYAEKLSAEANTLRAKINKEQRETKRLSGLVVLTAAEKSRLQNQLKDTETAHRDAMVELQAMKENMDRMEQERAEMVAEVEAQIERALESMAVGDMDVSDYTDSRAGSRASSRRSSDANKHPMRSFSTDSTLAESYGGSHEGPIMRETETIEEAAEEEEREREELDPKKAKRFSASEPGVPQLNAVDEGISKSSDTISKKVLEIQQKLENALAAEGRKSRRKTHAVHDSESELSEQTSVRSKPRRATSRIKEDLASRSRSGTTSSTQTRRASTPPQETATSPRQSRPLLLDPSHSGGLTPTHDVISSSDEGHSTPEGNKELRRIASGASLSATPSPPRGLTPLTPHLTGTTATDDEDNDFQSAYSNSPRHSYVTAEDEDGDEDLDEVTQSFNKASRRERERVSSTATYTQPSPTFSDSTVISQSHHYHDGGVKRVSSIPEHAGF